jgi:outer membrane protein OmpA-like peptidoglycan-associated protein
MSKLAALASTAMIGMLCSGCGTYWGSQAESVYKGQPVFEEKFFSMEKNSDNKLDATLPSVCSTQPSSWDGTTEAGQKSIRACTFAMKLLIDIRWSNYANALHGSVSYGSALLDTVSLGLNTAGSLTPGNANQILSAVAAGVGGVKTTINEDILYKNSVQMILLQMEKDRAAQAVIILTSLDTHKYRSMTEAAIDLYAYDRAGTWTSALVAMQADSGKATAECKAQLEATQLDSAKTGKDGETAKDKPASSEPCAPAAGKTKPLNSTTTEGLTTTIKFGSHSDVTLPADALPALKNIADKFASGKYKEINVQGNSDALETPSIQASFANKRFEAVRTKLKELLVADGKIKKDTSTTSGNTVVIKLEPVDKPAENAQDTAKDAKKAAKNEKPAGP